MLCPEVVGRDRERELLRARVEGLSTRHGGLVVLVGEAGAGKSLLARDYLADALHDEPVLCLCTARPEGSTATASASATRSPARRCWIVSSRPSGAT